ncbi:MAG: ATP-binding protein [Actinomycetes bacterium]
MAYAISHDDDQSMKWRLAAVLVGLTAMVLLVQDIPLALYLRSIESNRIITELQRDAFVVAGRSEDALADGRAVGDPQLAAMVQAYSESAGGTVTVVDSKGVLIATSDPQARVGSSYDSRPEIRTALGGRTDSGERNSATLGEQILYVAVPVLSGSETLGAVRLTYPASELDQRVNERVQGIGLVASLTLLASVLVAIVLAGTITRPLRRLQQTTAQLASGDLSARAEPGHGAPELRHLNNDLNTMANRIEKLVEAQRSFAADASHQLRTPLTVLRLRLDEAADTLEDNPQDASVPLDAARAETERLQHVIDGLLQLARTEGARIKLINVDLAEIVRERTEVWQPYAEEHGVELLVNVPNAATILAIPGGAEQILDNYIDNAISVSNGGSTVQVTVEVPAGQDSGPITLRVRDSGPGLTPEQRQRAFDRFWQGRADNSGTGIGLAIVSQLAEASEATVELLQSPTGGVDAVARFRR